MTLIQKTAQIVSGIPAFFSDGFSAYLQALMDCYHPLKTFLRTGKPGRPKNPVKEPPPDLGYGQIVKKTRKGRLVEITTRILLRLRENIPVNAHRFEQQWRPRTPAMAAGRIDHVWTFRELLTVKFAHVP